MNSTNCVCLLFRIIFLYRIYYLKIRMIKHWIGKIILRTFRYTFAHSHTFYVVLLKAFSTN